MQLRVTDNREQPDALLVQQPAPPRANLLLFLVPAVFLLLGSNQRFAFIWADTVVPQVVGRELEIQPRLGVICCHVEWFYFFA